ncbi:MULTISPECIES: hypothetical protein [unclassified Streptomyces]|uniref:hypothetical protein n=1 Tax=unclassified Streptomyces TaxID=2593676 RepID=UPI00225AC9D5|nr:MULTISPECIES: hypothetical protein [unclassified Streptomyces]WSP57361.1 hypothetical protein OG306_25475 [Streptomyces sp. NBC_01241]WSU21921.1 hypothetical protein OG508_13745 [Streptomyces sp. NBC_01108]WTE36087.1 hypothetical protein OH735_24870 [Streptomyces sp. NBC_01618]MCX4789182.1 hypothetical protein [Streptomyces sp. NBC_01221]MCX4795073.1 hypothetical protein [Streptomyces sp. NBC_01242]
MSVDPSDPETFEDVQPDEPDEETPRADAAEQRTDLQQRRDEPLTHIDRDRANVADAAEQARVVTQDEDDYR